VADYFVDQGAYSSALGTAPTWGVPQEGDGSNKNAATASSVGSVAFASAPSSGVISVFGASVSTSGVVGAASADAAANALAANINATSATVTSGFAVGTPELRNFVFARGPSGGAPAGTCQIMCRVGSASLNVTGIASTLSAAPTITQFAGGSGGCWGWLVNPAALGVGNSIAAAAYGVGFSTPMVMCSSAATGFQALPTLNDRQHARTGRNLTVVLPQGQNLIRGNLGWPLNLLFDTNEVWTGDATNGALTIELKPYNSTAVYMEADRSQVSTSSVSWAARRRGGLVFLANLSEPSSNFFIRCQIFFGSRQHFRNIVFREKAGSHVSSRMCVEMVAGYTQTPARFDGCEFDYSLNTTATLKGTVVSWIADRSFWLAFNDCDFKFSLNGVPFNTVALCPPMNYGNAAALHFRRCRFTTGNAAPLRLFSASSGMQTGLVEVVLDDCQGVTVDSAFLGLGAVGLVAAHTNRGMYQSRDTGRSMRFETRSGIASWDYLAAPAYPTLGATQPDGTPWSMRLDWYATEFIVTPADPFVSPALTTFYRSASAIRTATVQFLLDGTKAITSAGLVVLLTYVDATGVVRQESSADRDSLLTASTATWTGAGNYPTYVAKKVQLTTQYAVKQNTEVTVEVLLVRPMPGGSNSFIFVDPEVLLT
jgi:hypothetical protein